MRGDSAIESARDEAVESKSDSSEPASGSERSVILGALPVLLDDNPDNFESDASTGGSPDMAQQRWARGGAKELLVGCANNPTWFPLHLPPHLVQIAIFPGSAWYPRLLTFEL